MGYSIMIPFENEKEKAKMKGFLDEHYRPLKEVIKPLSLKGYQTEEDIAPHDDLDRGEVKEPVLGCYYGAGDSNEKRDYYYTICYWMAVYGGKKENGRPIFIYDGMDKRVVSINEPADKNSDYVEVNEFGYRKMSTIKQMEKYPKLAQLITASMKKRLEKIDAKIHEELKRLSQLWIEKENP